MNSIARSCLAFAILCRAAIAAGAGGPISGHVLDSDGKPVSGATVSLVAARSHEQKALDETSDRVPKAILETRTDAAGVFTLKTDRDAAEVVLRISAPLQPSFELENLSEAEGAEGLDIVLAAPNRCSGSVRDAAGQSVSGARVRAARRSDGGEEGIVFAETRTGSDGRFDIPNAPDGEFRISVSAAGFAPGSASRSGRSRPDAVILRRGGGMEGTVVDPEGKPVGGAIVVAGGSAGQTDAAGRYRIDGLGAGPNAVRVVWKDDLAARRDGVPVRAGETAKLDLRLGPSSAIAGAVRDEKTRKPIAGARIEVRRIGYSSGGSAEAEGRTDARGRFRVAGLLPTAYTVIGAKPGYLEANADATASAGAGAQVALALRRAGAIVGRVIGEDGRPIAVARVQWTSSTGVYRQFDPSAVTPRSTRTRKDGRFRLTGIPSGAGSLEARKDGFAPSRRDGISAAAGDSARPIVLTLRRGLEAHGRVLDRDGQPVPGAEIRIHLRNPGSEDLYWEDLSYGKPAAVADDGGRFVLGALEVGEYMARVSATAHGIKSFSGLAVTNPGPSTWKDFIVGPSAPVSGVVRNRDGDPVSGAAVFSFGGTDGVSAETQSDVEGRFLLDGFPEAAVVNLFVRAEGFARHRQTVTAPADNVVVTLATTATIRGRVRDAGTEKPIESFTVGWQTPRGTGISQADEIGVEAPDGAFELPDIVPGRVVLTATATGYVDGEIGGLELNEGELREDVVVSLKKGLELAGRVLETEHGGAVSGAIVGWEPSGTGESGTVYQSTAAGEFAVMPHSTRTDAEGRFHLKGLPPGRVRVTARHPDYREASKTLDASSSSDVELTLTVGGSIAGLVIDGGGRPVGGAQISLEELGGARGEWSGDEAKAAADGRFAFTHLSEGRFRVGATAPAGRAEPMDLVLAPDQKLDGVTLTLKPGARIKGQVTGLKPERLGGLHASAGGSEWGGEGMTDDAGQFEILNVPPGIYTVSVSLSVYGKSVSKKLEVPPDTDEVPVEILFEGSSLLSGRVLRSGQGVGGSHLSVEPDPEGGSLEARGVTGPDGAYRFEDLPDGAYKIYVNTNGAYISRPVTVSGDTTFDFLLGSGSLAGAVTDDETGAAIAGAQVQAETGAEQGGYEMRGATSDSLGAYEVADLDAGAYKVTGRRDGYSAKSVDANIGDERTTINIALRKSAGQKIRASDALTGRPLRGVDVLAYSGTGATAFAGLIPLDGEGRGEIPSLSPGPYALYVFAEGLSPRQADVTVPAAELGVALTPGGVLEVRAQAAAAGRIFDAAGRLYLNSPFRLNGEFPVSPPLTTLRNVAPGAYRLVIGTPDGEKSWDFSVTEGATTALELR